MATEIDRLEVLLLANFTKMEQQLKQAIAKNQQAKKAIEESWAGKGLTGAAEKGFENLTERIGEAARSIPVFGAALGALGPVGVAAAVAVGGFALALEQTEKAVEYAAGIEKLSETIGVSTDFIQKFNFAARQSEVDVGSADQAIKDLNVSLGAVQGNLPRAKQLAVVFKDALHMTPEDLRGYKDVGDLLPVIADKIKEAGSDAEKAAIAKKLGIEELLPLLKQGADGFNRLAQEAQDLGIVMDHSLIEKGVETAKKLKELDDVMQAQKNATFIEYADALIKVKEGFLAAEQAALRFLASITHTLPLVEQIKDAQAGIVGLEASAKRQGGLDANQQKMMADYQSKLVGLVARKQGMDVWNQAQEDARKVEGGAAKAIVPLKVAKTGKGPKDETIALDKAATDAYLSSLKDLTTAQAALETGISARAEREKQAVQQESDKKIADLNADILKVKASKLDKDKQGQLADLEAAKVNEQQIAYAKKILIDEQALDAQLAANIAHQQALTDVRAGLLTTEADHASALAGLADTAKERNTLERVALAKQQEADRIRADATLTDAKALYDQARAMGASADKLQPLLDALNAAQANRDKVGVAQADAIAAQVQAQQSPVQKYLHSIQDLSTTMEDAGVTAAKSLSAGLADAIVNAKSLGDVATSVFKQMATQLAQALIEKNITSPILKALSLAGGGGDIATMGSALTTLAGGTFSAAAGVALVGESGPELVRLPGGAQVITNNALRNLGMGGHGGGGTTITFDNRGAVIWEQAARQMMSYADRAAASAGMGAIGAARQITPNDLARSAGRRLS